MEKKTLGKDKYLTKDEYGDCDLGTGVQVTELDINPITIEEQNKLKQIFELLDMPIPSRFFGHTEIIIKTQELDSDKVYKLFSGEFKKKKGGRHSSQP